MSDLPRALEDVSRLRARSALFGGTTTLVTLKDSLYRRNWRSINVGEVKNGICLVGGGGVRMSHRRWWRIVVVLVVVVDIVGDVITRPSNAAAEWNITLGWKILQRRRGLRLAEAVMINGGLRATYEVDFVIDGLDDGEVKAFSSDVGTIGRSGVVIGRRGGGGKLAARRGEPLAVEGPRGQRNDAEGPNEIDKEFMPRPFVLCIPK